MSYQTINLTLNVPDLAEAETAAAARARQCNPGGSWICWSPTRGCGKGVMTCFGTSYTDTKLEAAGKVASGELESLQEELAAVLSKYVTRGE